MAGRIETAMGRLMGMYGLAVSQSGVDPVVLLTALSTKVNGSDSALCLRMADELQRCRAEIISSHMPEEERTGQTALGETDAHLVFMQHPNDYASYLLDHTDFVAEHEKEQIRRKAEKKRNLMIALGCVGVLALGIAIYNLPYFAEKRAFGRVEKAYEDNDNIEVRIQSKQYAEDYPDGKNIDEVMWLTVASERRSGDPLDVLDSAEQYITSRPQGKYADRCEAIYDSLWNDEIARYDKVASANGFDRGTDFVRGMMVYMRDNHVRTVAVTGVPTLSLKEYDEYPLNVRQLLEALSTMDDNTVQIGKKSARLPDDLVTIKDKITIEQARGWTSDVISSLQKGFNRVLTPDFITFVDSKSLEDKNKKDYPTVRVDFTVNTEEENFGGITVPSIWTYTSTQNGHIEVEKSYILGISMDFKADFNYPGAKGDFTVTGSGDPGEEQIQVDKSEAYNVMCDRCVEKFADKVSQAIGLGKSQQ